jgi:hypothetical protein
MINQASNASGRTNKGAVAFSRSAACCRLRLPWGSDRQGESGQGESGQGDRRPPSHRLGDRRLIVATAKVLDERVPAAITLALGSWLSPRRDEASPETTVVSLDTWWWRRGRCGATPLEQLIEYRWGRRCPIGHHLDRCQLGRADRRLEEPVAA